MSGSKKVRINTLIQNKKDGKKITALTAWDYPTGLILDQSGVDIILVGDSLGNNVLGYESTLPVTMDQMVHHSAAVSRGVNRALQVCDMPFLSYKISDEQALENAGRLVSEGGAEAVKVEGCEEIAFSIEAIVEAGIPVMGHLGLLPQSVHALSGYRIQGREEEAAEQLIKNALMLQELGCFAMVLELVTADLAKEISQELEIPTIGIGSGVGCDGQILVSSDMLGLNQGTPPKFVKQYANLSESIGTAAKDFCKEVQDGTYPGTEHSR